MAAASAASSSCTRSTLLSVSLEPEHGAQIHMCWQQSEGRTLSDPAAPAGAPQSHTVSCMPLQCDLFAAPASGMAGLLVMLRRQCPVMHPIQYVLLLLLLRCCFF
jgi:hypothetical protein